MRSGNEEVTLHCIQCGDAIPSGYRVKHWLCDNCAVQTMKEPIMYVAKKSPQKANGQKEPLPIAEQRELAQRGVRALDTDDTITAIIMCARLLGWRVINYGEPKYQALLNSKGHWVGRFISWEHHVRDDIPDFAHSLDALKRMSFPYDNLYLWESSQLISHEWSARIWFPDSELVSITASEYTHKEEASARLGAWFKMIAKIEQGGIE